MYPFKLLQPAVLLGMCTLLTGVFSVGNIHAQGTQPATRVAGSKVELEIRKSAEIYCEAFNRHDAKGVSAHWEQDALYVNEDGERFQGREAIEKEHEAFFGVNKEVTLKLDIESIRVITDNTAIEEGIAILGPQPVGAPRIASRYVATHVKKGDKWLIAEMRDSRIDAGTEPANLSDLD